PFPAYVPMPAFMPGKGIGHFFGAMRIDGFRPAEDFKRDMDLWITQFRNAPAVDPLQPVVIPGDPERVCEQERMKEGVPVESSVVKELETLAEKFGLEVSL
ncbi:MAG: Ldh family oxidoreductase, partial [Chitinophagaceae bacterium]